MDSVQLYQEICRPRLRRSGDDGTPQLHRATEVQPGDARDEGAAVEAADHSGAAEYLMHRDEAADPPALVCVVGKTELRYHLRAIDDLHAMLRKHGDWMLLGSADEQKPAAEGTVEAWGRSAKNPVKGWYGLKKGLRGRFGMYLPPLLEALGLAEVEHNAKNNRMRAK